MNTLSRRIFALLLLLCLLCQPFVALAQEELPPTLEEDPEEMVALEEDPDALAAETSLEESAGEVETHVATNTVALKVRRGPGEEYKSIDSITADSIIYILELGSEWCKIRTRYDVGFVKTKYLTDIRDYDASLGLTGAEVNVPTPSYDVTTDSSEPFKQGYKAFAVKNALIYKEMDERSRIIGKVPTYEEVLVSHVQGDWCYAKYGKDIGYIRNSSLFKWDRIDPYAGDIPGCIVYPAMVFVKHSTDIISYADRDKEPKKQEVFKTINPGSALCVELPDEDGLYKTPYWRTTGYITEEDIAYTIPVVPYAEAQPGDLISVMTTYYALGIHTLQYQGRNWNIYLATTNITDAVLAPNEEFDIYKYIGPYRKSTGYLPAPIASPTALWGYGGGTCQVSTTLYNTLIQVPLLINHRKVHANSGAKYIPKGFDAAVGGGDINLVFTNTLPYTIRLTFFMSDGVLTCCIFRDA